MTASKTAPSPNRHPRAKRALTHTACSGRMGTRNTLVFVRAVHCLEGAYGPLELNMTTDTAREFARALLKAADKLDAGLGEAR